MGYPGRGGGKIAVIAGIGKAKAHRGDAENSQGRHIPGIELRKCFRILIEGEGGGVPHGCPTTTIDSGPPPVGEVEIRAVVVFAAVMFAFKTDTVLDPLFAT